MSIRESILGNIKTTLSAMTVAGGYNYAPVTVERWKQKGQSTQGSPHIIIHTGPENKHPGPHPQQTCVLSVLVEYGYRQDDTDSTESDAIVSKLLEDVETALLADNTRGGYAEDTTIIGNIPFEVVDGQPRFGVMVQVEIQYKHALLDPASYT